MQDITIELSDGFHEIYSNVHRFAISKKHEIITPAHFLLEMINYKFCVGYVILFRLGTPMDELKAGLQETISGVPKLESDRPRLSESLAKVLDTSLITAQSLGENKIDSGHFLVGILRNLGLKEYTLLRSLGVSYSDVLHILKTKDELSVESQEIVSETTEVIDEEELGLKEVFKKSCILCNSCNCDRPGVWIVYRIPNKQYLRILVCDH